MLLAVAMISFSFDMTAKVDPKDTKSDKEKADTTKKKDPYKDIIKDAVTKEGVFITHFTKDNKLYFELNDSIADRVFLISNRISSTNNTQDFVAGQMVNDPFMVRFAVDTNRVVMYKIQVEAEVPQDDAIKLSFDRNIGDAIIKTFKPKAKNGENVVIDMSDFFGKNESCISPLKPASPLAIIFGGKKPVGGTFSASDSYITGVKTFSKNIEIKSLMNFTDPKKDSYTINVHRSLVLLPKEPMKRRIQDNRVGYFSNYWEVYSSKTDGAQTKEYINRWRIEPKAEDMDKYLAGELVEPEKPIVYYVDTAFPEKWRKTIIQGIEDWQPAFEAAGFKNAITARMYPTKEENPDFDPDDITYSCFKYAVTDIANAMGPSYIDPRSGEILVGDVIWYHNVVSLVHNWRFVQTGAVDSRVRKPIFDDEVMNESLRYVASHEIGHTVGLMHNMGASFSYPVDSLRSPSFTQKYGTTPSIMDYARNNYVAQPGDFEKGVAMTPPILGVYDMHAINWGYRIFGKDLTPEQDKVYMDKIVDEKKGDDMYRFGAQQIFGNVDYTDLTEDLSDDHVAASEYCVSNLKIIMENLEEWHLEKGEKYTSLIEVYKEIINQYLRVVSHVSDEIGGLEFKEVMQGEPSENKSVRYGAKEDQKRAMLWLVDQARTCTDWITPNYVIDRFPADISPNENDKLPASLTASLFYKSALARMYVASEKLGNEDAYKVEEYIEDLLDAIFEKSIKGDNLTTVDMNMEMAALECLVSLAGVSVGSSKSRFFLQGVQDDFKERVQKANRSAVICNHAYSGCTHHASADHNNETLEENFEDSFFRINFDQAISPNVLVKPLCYAKIKWIRNLYNKKRRSANDATENFYDMQLVKIDQILSSRVTFSNR